MRGFIALLVAVLVAIGAGIGVVAATGSSGEAAAAQFAERSISSLASSRYTQLTITANDARSASARRTTTGLTLVMDISDEASAPLTSAHAANIGIDLSLASAGQRLVDVRLLGAKSAYVWVDLDKIVGLLGIPAGTATALGLGASLSSHWFQLPPALLSPLLKDFKSGSTQSSTPSAERQAFAQQLESALENNGTISMSSTVNGLKDVHASLHLQPFLQQFDSAVLPLIANSTSRLPRSIPPIPASAFSSVQGTASADLYALAGNAQLKRMTFSYPSTKSNLTVQIAAAHQPVLVAAPAGSVLLPQSVIEAIRDALKRPLLS